MNLVLWTARRAGPPCTTCERTESLQMWPFGHQAAVLTISVPISRMSAGFWFLSPNVYIRMYAN